MKKRFFGIILVMVLLVSICSPFTASAGGYYGGVPTYDVTTLSPSYSPVTICADPVKACQPNDCVTDVINGKDYLYTTSSGTPAVFDVYNIDDRQLVATHELPGTTTVWKHVIDSQHNVYIIANATLFKYNPFQNTMTNLGVVGANQTECSALVIDENDNVYTGTFPAGKIIKYDAANNQFIDMGVVDSPENGEEIYVRALAYHNGYLYAGLSTSKTSIYKINVNNPSDKASYPIPESTDPNNYQLSQIEWLYAMTAAGDYIIIYATQEAKCAMIVFDTVNNTFLTDIGFTGSFKGLYTTPVKDNKAYFTATGEVYYFDTTTARVVDCGWKAPTDMPYKAFMGGGWVTLEGNTDFPNQTYVSIDWQGDTVGNLNFWNMEAHKYMVWDDCKLPGGAIAIQSLENGPYGEVYVSGYRAFEAARFCTCCGEINKFPMGQAEGMVEYDGEQFFGTYTNAELYKYDPGYDGTDPNPKFLGAVGEDQDRPFAMCAADNKIFMGTVPKPGLVGGALAIYDLETEQMETIRNIVPNQSVMSLAYREDQNGNKFIYGTTTAFGGIGSTIVDPVAKIFIYDVQNETVEYFVPNIRANFSPTWLGSIAFDKNGKLWVATGGTIFSVNPETHAVSDVLSFEDCNYDNRMWRPHYIRFDEEGFMYVNLSGIKVINPENMHYVALPWTLDSALYTIGPDNNFYYSKGAKLMMLPHDQIVTRYFLENGPNGEIYACGNNYGIRYNTSSGAINSYQIGDVKGSVECNGKQYFTVTGGNVYEYDPSLPSSDTNPRLVGTIPDNLEQPCAMCSGNGKVFIGTKNFGSIGGALAIYDVATEVMDIVPAMVANHSIMSMTYKDGFIYGTTSVYGGTTPVDESARIFVYDVVNGIKVKDFAPNLDFTAYWLGGIGFDPRGYLWVVTGTTIFRVDPNTEQIVLKDGVKISHSFGVYNYSLSEPVYEAPDLYFPSQLHALVNLNGMKAINLDYLCYYPTYFIKYAVVDEVGDTPWYTLKDGILYFYRDSKIMKANWGDISWNYVYSLWTAD